MKDDIALRAVSQILVTQCPEYHKNGYCCFNRQTSFNDEEIENIMREAMMTQLTDSIEKIIQSMRKQLNDLQFGNIEFVIINGRVDRVELKQSIKTNKNKG